MQAADQSATGNSPEPEPQAPRDGIALLGAYLADRFGDDCRITRVAPVGTASRNDIARLEISGTGEFPRTIMTKHARRTTDPFFAHHLRREERLLDLLARFAPGLAPRCFGLLLDPENEGWLLLEDGGESSLADWLERAEPAERRQLLADAVAAARRLHAVLQLHSRPFWRTCYAVDLDRYTHTTVRSRFQIAWRRLSRLAQETTRPATTTIRAWETWLAPLFQPPRQLIHNSLSPLNVVVDANGRVAIVDFETMTRGPIEIDLAELLRQPFAPLSWTETIELLHDDSALSVERLRLAALARSFDYAGSNARQWLADQGRAAPAARLVWYCREVEELTSDTPALAAVTRLAARAADAAGKGD